MIRAFQMIFSPEGTWPKIAEKNRHMIFILFLSTLPLMVSCLALEGFGIDRLGESMSEFGRVNVERTLICKYLLTHLAADLIFLFLGAYFLMGVARSFHSNASYSLLFSTLAIASSPIFLMHALDGIPAIHTWLCWGIGFGLSIRALYHAVAVNIRPEQTKGFGLYIISVFIVGFLSGLGHFISMAILHGKMLR
ncbi:MAG TPA: YIP1 family protein [Verrucomicrobiae bacterium]|jgi:hypothetical protein